MVIELSPFFEFGRNFDRLRDEFFSPGRLARSKSAYPPLNLSEDEQAIYVHCELPGVNIEEVDITFSDATLAIKGELEAGDGRYYRRERPTGAFQRVVNIKTNVERDGIKASYRDGILEITLPKAEEVKPRKITIEAS